MSKVTILVFLFALIVTRSLANLTEQESYFIKMMRDTDDALAGNVCRDLILTITKKVIKISDTMDTDVMTTLLNKLSYINGTSATIPMPNCTEEIRGFKHGFVLGLLGITSSTRQHRQVRNVFEGALTRTEQLKLAGRLGGGHVGAVIGGVVGGPIGWGVGIGVGGYVGGGLMCRHGGGSVWGCWGP
jgi:hypothetical protein